MANLLLLTQLAILNPRYPIRFARLSYSDTYISRLPTTKLSPGPQYLDSFMVIVKRVISWSFLAIINPQKLVNNMSVPTPQTETESPSRTPAGMCHGVWLQCVRRGQLFFPASTSATSATSAAPSTRQHLQQGEELYLSVYSCISMLVKDAFKAKYVEGKGLHYWLVVLIWGIPASV